MIIPGFIGGTYVAQSPIVGCEECWNLFAEAETLPGQQEPKTALYRDPGLRVFGTAGSGPIRGLFMQDGRTFIASGSEFYEAAVDGTMTLLGTIAPGAGTVTFGTNGAGGEQLLVLASGYVYILTLTTNAFAIVADADLPNGSIASIGFIDGYALALVRDTATFYISALEDFSAWDPTDIFEKSRTSDFVRAMVIMFGQAWLFGSKTIEPWYDSGDASTPFSPVPDVMVMQGILSTDAWTFIANTVYWVGENEDGGRMAYQASGFSPKRISTHAVEAAWRTYRTVTDVTCWDYLHQGHAFVQFDFPTEDVSWVFDATTNLWHKRGYWDVSAGQYRAHLGRCHAFAFSKHLVGSRIDGIVYEQAADVYADGTALHRWMRRAPTLRKELRDEVHWRFYVTCEVGTTPLLSGQGSNPQIMMRYSDTNTKTWSVERWKSTGKTGKYDARVVWNRLGMAFGPHGRVYEISGTDPVPIALREAGVDLTEGAA